MGTEKSSMKVNDKELIKQVLEGKKEAFEMIVRKYQAPIINYLARMIGEYQQAVDLSQEVFVKAYFSISKFDFRYKFSSWLFKIASNLCIDMWRKRKVKTISLDQSLSQQDELYIQVANGKPSPIEKYERKQIAKKIEKAIKQLPPTLKELFILRHINELSYQEIAQIKDMPIGSVKNKVFRAKERLKSLIEEQ